MTNSSLFLHLNQIKHQKETIHVRLIFHAPTRHLHTCYVLLVRMIIQIMKPTAANHCHLHCVRSLEIAVEA